MSPEEKKLTAYHEAGHAIIGWHMIPKGHDPIHKVTIIPRGKALGVTMFLPDQDRYSHTKQYLEAKLASMFGGQVAEALIFGAAKITTGASNDIEVATNLARNMVMHWGLSEAIGPLHYHHKDEPISSQTMENLEKATRSIIDAAYQVAQQVLKDNMDTLHKMAELLIKHETLDAKQVNTLMNGQPMDSDTTSSILKTTPDQPATQDEVAIDSVSTT